MKFTKRLISLFIIAVMALSLAACGGGTGGETTYKVTLKDALGNPYTSGVVVQFMDGSTQAGMQSCDENGVATKTLASGKYTIALKFSDDEANYYYEEVKVSASNPEAEVIVSQKAGEKTISLYPSGEEKLGCEINAGCTYVELEAGVRNYFLFTPTQSGNYEFSVMNNEDAVIGYYGMPSFVQENSAAEVVDNKFTQNVREDMIGSDNGGTITLVIGVDIEEGDETDCIVVINRLSDAIKTYEDEPWTVYEKTVELSPYTLPEGAEMKEFDLTASTDTYNFVYNETDGFYHLDSEDGPLVLVYLAEDCQYINCFKSMLDRSGVVEYCFDENGDFEKKVSYSECLFEYLEYVDEKAGVYPLTEDLKYIIQRRGEYAEWWDFDSSNFRFQDMDGNNMADINTEIAWLLMCCYIE